MLPEGGGRTQGRCALVRKAGRGPRRAQAPGERVLELVNHTAGEHVAVVEQRVGREDRRGGNLLLAQAGADRLALEARNTIADLLAELAGVLEAAIEGLEARVCCEIRLLEGAAEAANCSSLTTINVMYPSRVAWICATSRIPVVGVATPSPTRVCASIPSGQRKARVASSSESSIRAPRPLRSREKRAAEMA